jgi:tetratricopeptide (TPR) repeat protein
MSKLKNRFYTSTPRNRSARISIRALFYNLWRRVWSILEQILHKLHQLDWLWNFLTLFCLAISMCLGIYVFPKFWAGGPTVEGFAGTIVPAILSALAGNNAFEFLRKGQSLLAKGATQMPFTVSIYWIQEILFIITLVITLIIGYSWMNLGEFSTCYYDRSKVNLDARHGSQREDNSNLGKNHLCKILFLPSKIGGKDQDKSMAQIENDLKRSIALNPDNKLSHLYLGWIYDMRQDYKEAEYEYGVAMQAGSLKARIKLARMYLEKNTRSDTLRAANLLMQGHAQILELKKEKSIDATTEIRSWNNMVAWANLELGLLETSLTYSKKAILAHWRLKELVDIRNQSEQLQKKIEIGSTTAFCSYAELMTRMKSSQEGLLSKQEFLGDSKQKGTVSKELAWEKCREESNIYDIDDYPWLVRINKYLPNEQKL